MKSKNQIYIDGLTRNKLIEMIKENIKRKEEEDLKNKKEIEKIQMFLERFNKIFKDIDDELEERAKQKIKETI